MNRALGLPDFKPKRVCKFKVGDKVRLSNYGYSVFKPSSKEETMAAVSGCFVIETSPLDENIWNVDVEGPLSGFMFDDNCFEIASS